MVGTPAAALSEPWYASRGYVPESGAPSGVISTMASLERLRFPPTATLSPAALAPRLARTRLPLPSSRAPERVSTPAVVPLPGLSVLVAPAVTDPVTVPAPVRVCPAPRAKLGNALTSRVAPADTFTEAELG